MIGKFDAKPVAKGGLHLPQLQTDGYSASIATK